MAKITGPLLSLGASGQIGKTLVFAKWRGVGYVRQYVVPANPQTVAQQLTRNTFATIRSMFKIASTIARAPFDAFATGRPLLGVNQYLKSNILAMLGDVNMDNFVSSPGARGGLPPDSVIVTTGVGSGEIDIAVNEPSIPTDWTLTAAQAVGFPDQAPDVAFVGPMVEGEDVATPFSITLAGLGSGVACQGSAFLKWLKPNGDIAYSVSITGQAVSGV